MILMAWPFDDGSAIAFLRLFATGCVLVTVVLMVVAAVQFAG